MQTLRHEVYEFSGYRVGNESSLASGGKSLDEYFSFFQSLKMMPLNVLGTPLLACSHDPITGYFRDGCCQTNELDLGTHVVCAKVTAEFLEFSRSRGNDLMTPRPGSNFPGLQPGDQWCLCATRWLEAFHAGLAPPVVLEATHSKALEMITLAQLQDN